MVRIIVPLNIESENELFLRFLRAGVCSQKMLPEMWLVLDVTSNLNFQFKLTKNQT